MKGWRHMREKKRLQSEKIRAIGEALRSAGIDTLKLQVEILGLSRSTTYWLMRAEHKHSGVSKKVVQAMLASAKLPASVRAAIVEYVEGKRTGAYGHNVKRNRD
jgi:hypothetical protein